MFVSRYQEGRIIQSDFTALEIYIQAILSGCKQLTEDLRAGLDLHVMRLATKEGMPYSDVLKLCKGDKASGTPADPAWDYKRTKAKVFSFQRAYGAGAQKISDSTGLPLPEIEALIAAEEARYPEIGAYAQSITTHLEHNRRPTGLVLSHPSVPGVVCHIGAAQYRTPDGKLYSYTEKPAPEFVLRSGKTASFSPTEIKNYPVQGTGGEWAKAAMWLAVRAFYRTRNFGGQGVLVNQVHDALYADAGKNVAHQVAATLHACMEAASDFMEYYFNWTVAVPVPSDTTWGASMMDEDSADIQELAAILRKDLRQQYMGNYLPSFDINQGSV